MLGVINRQELSKSIGRMEIASTIAGAAVVVGVLVEVAPDLVKSIATPRWPTLETLGAIVVAVGVSLEVVMASRIARKSELIQEAANKEIALINERAENAGRQAADANLARVKIEERLRQLSTGRKISGEARANIKAILGELTDRSVDIFLFDEHWLEGKLFADQLNSLFRESGWESKVWVCAGGRLGVGSLTIAVATEEFTPAGRIGPLQNAAGALAHALNRSGIEVTMLGEGFDRTKEVLPWHILDHSMWDSALASKLRIEVSPLQHVPFRDQLS